MRLREFQSFLQERKINASILVSVGMEPDPNFLYFTGYEGAGALIIRQSGRPILLAPQMEQERARKSRTASVKVLEKKRLFDSVREHVGRTRAIGIDGSALTLTMAKSLRKSFRNTKATDVSGKIRELRAIKTGEEVSRIRRACREADSVLQRCLKNFREFGTESEAAAFLQHETFRRGLDIPFKPIVASGKNGSMPHHTPKNTKLSKGLCVIDFGVKYKGYCSDITRTIGIGSVPTTQTEKYQKLLGVQQQALASITDSMKCSLIYGSVVKALGKDSPYFTHGLGHGIGVEIHELPNLTPSSTDRMRKNMAFTIEPGIYFPRKFGIRIEDSALLAARPETLTKTTKELVIV